MRYVTTGLEVFAMLALVAGVFVLFGVGWALIALSAVAVTTSWLVSR